MDPTSLADGYRRGWGLMHGDLRGRINTDALFLQAIAATAGRSIVVPEKLCNLFLLVTQSLAALDSRNIIEFGSYRGGSALFLSYLLKQTFPDAKCFACDTFAGMPPTSDKDMHGAGNFSDCDLEGFEKLRGQHQLDNLVIVKGRVEDTLPELVADHRFGLAHIDLDIYDPIRFAQSSVWPALVPGGYLVYDDTFAPSCLGATRAVEEFMQERRLFSEQVWPHQVLRKQ
jgi:predicted O-methyltransferase YrrM